MYIFLYLALYMNWKLHTLILLCFQNINQWCLKNQVNVFQVQSFQIIQTNIRFNLNLLFHDCTSLNCFITATVKLFKNVFLIITITTKKPISQWDRECLSQHTDVGRAKGWVILSAFYSLFGQGLFKFIISVIYE